MSVRRIGEVAIKIVGVYYGVSAIFQLAAGVSNFLLPAIEGFPSAGQLFSLNLVSALAFAAVAAVCLLRGAAPAPRP